MTRLAGGVLIAAGLSLLAACSSLGPTTATPTSDSAVPAATYGSGPIRVALITLDRADDLAGGATDSAFLAAQLSADVVAKAPITLLVKEFDAYKTISIDYHGGLQYPKLERIQGKPDYLSQVLAPMK